jgi:hypothetical protein
MSLNANNAIVKEYMTNYFSDELENEHVIKHASVLLWASKFFKHINRILRTNSYNDIFKNTVWTKKYMMELFYYFKVHGLTREKLIKKDVNFIYRGVDKEFTLTPHFKGNGLIATSFSKHIAEKFADKDGQVICINVHDFEEDTICVMLTDEIADYLLTEDEVLLLPGSFELIKYKNNLWFYKYKVNSSIVKMIRDKIHIGGGIESSLVDIPFNSIKNIQGKFVLWWRAVVNRKVEVLSWMKIPEEINEAIHFMKNNVFPHDASFDTKINIIPEFADLHNKIDDLDPNQKKIYKSYFVHMALFDGKKVITLRYGLPEKMSKELYENNDERVTKYLETHWNWLGKYVQDDDKYTHLNE